MRRLSSGIAVGMIYVVAMVFCAATVLYGQSSPHGPLKQACVDCHSTESWKELAKPMKFDHATTGFSLQGAHMNAQCLQCHTTKRFAGTSTDCFQCHTTDFTKALSPNHQLGKFSHDCLSCHTMIGWKPSVFQHSKTNFQLIGAHLSIECSSCHTNNRFSGLSQDCYACHQKDFNQTITPNHRTALFSHDCLSCHSFNGWRPATFDHNKTHFRIAGAHLSIECSSCHTGGKYSTLPMDCYSCHTKDFIQTTEPNHSTAQFSHDCMTCHTDVSWKPSTFDHNKTEFRLGGAHLTTECALCHVNGKFKGIAKDCYFCHQKEFAKTVSPNHTVMALSKNCLECHSNTSWKPSTFDHNKTNFRLIGSHQAVDCASCHGNKQAKSVTADCFGCHQQEFTKTVLPNHLQSQFSHDCLLCHTSITWKPSTFDHNKTNFQLLGAHKTAECSSCHSSGQFKGLPTECYPCHQQDFVKTTTPNHSLAQFSHDCLSCHTSVAWKPSTFDHNKTAFKLLGAHAAAECSSCHASGQFKGLPSDCYSCHQSDYLKTTTPNHSLAQFSHDCSTCHSVVGWKPSTFNHSTTTFPLTGAHTTTDCLFCHKNGQFKGTASDCFTCHQSDFTTTIDPNHVTGNFDHNCLTCHTTVAWSPASFDHNKTNFALTGAHKQVECSKCHVGGKFAGTLSTCISCHQLDYNATTNPAHATAHYPTECLTCHTTTAWKPSTFDHTPFFPINSSAKHRPGRWTTCQDCHENPTNFKSFTCISCHEHNKTSMDSEHQGKTGYVYESSACYKCHPRGN
ncbi:MAG: hypothetical protein WDA22_14925 [Bacteroidota bacterium]